MRDPVSDFLGVLSRGERASEPLRTWVGQITRSDGRGVYATELDGDEEHPTGPLLGATYRNLRTCPDGPHNHPLLPLPRGTLVLVEQTEHGPWVTAYDEGSMPQ